MPASSDEGERRMVEENPSFPTRDANSAENEALALVDGMVTEQNDRIIVPDIPDTIDDSPIPPAFMERNIVPEIPETIIDEPPIPPEYAETAVGDSKGKLNARNLGVRPGVTATNDDQVIDLGRIAADEAPLPPHPFEEGLSIREPGSKSYGATPPASASASGGGGFESREADNIPVPFPSSNDVSTPANAANFSAETHLPQPQVQSSYQDASAPAVQQPPSSMAITTPPVEPSDPPPFFEVEAQLVEVPEDHTVYDAIPLTVGSDDRGRPCWKWYQRIGLAFVICAFGVVIGAVFGRQQPLTTTTSSTSASLATSTVSDTTSITTVPVDSSSTSSSSTVTTSTSNTISTVVTTTTSSTLITPEETTTTAPRAPIRNICPKFKHTLLEDDCADFDCEPLIAMDQDTGDAVITRAGKIRFFSNAGGNFEATQTIETSRKVIVASAIHGDLAAVGPYMYNRDASGNWKQGMDMGLTTKISMDDNVFAKVDINGKAVYIFRRNESSSWKQEAIITQNEFGNYPSVAIKGDLLLVGAYEAGIAFVYQYFPSGKQWTHNPVKLTNEDCSGDFLFFGNSVAITEEDGFLVQDQGLMIGCTGGATGQGAIYYYIKQLVSGEYEMNQKIFASDGMPGDFLGDFEKVAVSGNIMIAGTRRKHNGKVYVFMRTNNVWVEVAKIDAPANVEDFGSQVALSYKTALIRSSTNVYSYTLDC